MHLHVATRKGLFVFDLDLPIPAIISRHFLADNLSISHVDSRDGRWYAALDHGHFGVKLHRSDDQGTTWVEIAAPKYPERKVESEHAVGADGRPLAWSLKRIWSMSSGGSREPGRLWCGTIPGALFRSDDSGTSWQLVESLWNHPDRLKWFGGGADYPGIHSICVDPRNPHTVRIAVSCGGVWCTRDGGQSWNNTSSGMFAEYLPKDQQENPNVQDPHRMVQCKTQPDRMWIQHHNGVFQSRDAGMNWTHCPNIPPSGKGFGFAVAVHPLNGDTAWLVPAVKDEHRLPADGQVVVSKTSDGGRQWEVLRKGLPQKDAYDLVYRHALDVCDAGQLLAFGSTTGALWCSRDGGMSWLEITSHLPPIHAVQMVHAVA